MSRARLHKARHRQAGSHGQKEIDRGCQLTEAITRYFLPGLLLSEYRYFYSFLILK